MVEVKLYNTTTVTPKKLGIVFRYSRANIYSYHALIGALEITPDLNSIPIYIPTPKNLFSKINELLKSKQMEHLAICLSASTFQLDKIQKVIQKLASHPKKDQLTIIVGGPHASALPDDFLSVGADLVVIGEGEKTFIEIIRALLLDLSWQNNKGIAYRDAQKKVVLNELNDFIDLNDYPPFAPEHCLYSALEISRGCKFGCTFCQTPKLFGKKVRTRRPDVIIKWAKHLLSIRDSWDFRFITPNAFGYGARSASEPNIPYLEKLLKGIDALNARKGKRIFLGTFPSEVRPESVTEETLALTKEYCYNDNLTMGAQTGSPKVLQAIKRGHTLEDVHQAVDLANDFDFTMNVDIIIGFPEETSEDQYLTLEFCKELIQKGCKIHMHYLIPLPGTAYEGAQPRPIEEEILQILKKWTNNGKIFGSWQYQYDKIARGL